MSTAGFNPITLPPTLSGFGLPGNGPTVNNLGFRPGPFPNSVLPTSTVIDSQAILAAFVGTPYAGNALTAPHQIAMAGGGPVNIFSHFINPFPNAALDSGFNPIFGLSLGTVPNPTVPPVPFTGTSTGALTGTGTTSASFSSFFQPTIPGGIVSNPSFFNNASFPFRNTMPTFFPQTFNANTSVPGLSGFTTSSTLPLNQLFGII